MFGFFWAKRIKIKCPDGTYRFVCKKPEDAFPYYVNDWNAGLKVGIENLEEIKANMEGEIKVLAAHALLKIDAINASAMQNFNFAYEAYASDPCSQLEYLKEKVDKIINNDLNMRSLMVKLSLLRMYIDGDARELEKNLNGINRFLEKGTFESEMKDAHEQAENAFLIWARTD